jgi:hypothetical protein
MVLGGQLGRETPHAVGRRIHLAEETHLPVSSGIGHRHRVAPLGDIDPDESFPWLGHGLSSLVGRGS